MFSFRIQWTFMIPIPIHFQAVCDVLTRGDIDPESLRDANAYEILTNRYSRRCLDLHEGVSHEGRHHWAWGNRWCELRCDKRR